MRRRHPSLDPDPERGDGPRPGRGEASRPAGGRPRRVRRAARALAFVLVAATPLLAGLGPAAANAGDDAVVRIAGSDSMVPFLTAWGLAVREGGVEVVVEGHGSSTGPPALVSGRADLAAMTRPMSYAELDAFRRRVGGQPIAFVVAIDALLVFVHADNPIEGLSLGQVDAIFSRTRRCGERAPITRWSELGLSGEFARHQIVLYGLGPRSGTRDAFRNLALCGDGFRDGIRTMPGRMRATTAVAESAYAIGYGGLGDRRAGVRAVPLAHDDLAPFVAPDAVGLESGAYPLVRWMYLYARRDGPGLRDPALRAFLAHALSETGQRAVRSVGFLPVPPSRMAAERGKLP